MTKINFIPTTYTRSCVRRRETVRCGSLLGVTVLLAGCWMLFARQQHADLDQRLAELDARIAGLTDVGEEVPSGQSSSPQLVMLRRLQPPLSTTSMVATVVELMPESATLTRFLLEVPPVDPVPVDPAQQRRSASRRSTKPDPMRLTLEGIAPDSVTIARLIGQLDEHPIFFDVELGYSRPAEGGTLIAREFQITATTPVDRRYEAIERAQVSHAN